MLRKVEWGVQNGVIPKIGVLPVTALFFQKFYFSLITFYKELISCTGYPNDHVHTFSKR